VVAEEKQNSLIQSGISINILFVLFWLLSNILIDRFHLQPKTYLISGILDISVFMRDRRQILCWTTVI
jgi:hypothetical protein